jgi:hypothetical protein
VNGPRAHVRDRRPEGDERVLPRVREARNCYVCKVDFHLQ